MITMVTNVMIECMVEQGIAGSADGDTVGLQLPEANGLLIPALERRPALIPVLIIF